MHEADFHETIIYRKSKAILMDDVAASFADLLDENSVRGAYDTSLGNVVKDLTRRYAEKKVVQGRQILVVTSAADFDSVALTVRDGLEALGAVVKLACVSYSWFTWQDGRHSADWRATYREKFGDANFDIVIAASVVSEAAELITVGTATVLDNSRWEPVPLEYASIDVIIAATVPGVREAFEAAVTPRHYQHERIWAVGVTVPEMVCSGPVSPSMKRAGVTDAFKSGHIYPQHLLPADRSWLPGSWEGSRPTRPGFISDAEDMMHDLEEIDRRDAGVLTDVKRATIRRAAKRLGYSKDH